MNNNKTRGISGFTIILCIMLMFGMYWFLGQAKGQSMAYTYQDFREDLKDKEVVSVEIRQNKVSPTGTLRIEKKSGQYEELHVSDVNSVQALLEDYNMGNYYLVDVPQDSWFATTILPTLLMVGALLFMFAMMNRQGGSNSKAMNFGKSRAKMNTDMDKKVTFAQVAGLKEEKEELEEIVDFLKTPGKYIQVGARIPKGVLLEVLRAPVRHCLQERSQEKRGFRSLRFQVLTLWKCLLVSALPVSVTCLQMRRRMHHVLSLSMKSMQWQDDAEQVWAADMMRESRH